MLDEDQVRLKNIMGIKPGYYLACLYGVIILIVLFFVFLYPGISNPGSVISVRSEPWGAAVLVDGTYMDAAPCEVFIKKGQRLIELRLPGFLPKQTEKKIEGRLFASIFFPLKIEITEKLEASSPAEAFVNEAMEYAAWTFTGEPSAAYQIPLSLSEGAYRLAYSSVDPAVKKSMEDTIAFSARFAVTRAGLRDLIRAKMLLDNNGLSPSPLSLLASAADITGYLADNPAAALWLASTLQGDAQSVLTASSWFSEAARGREEQNQMPAAAITRAAVRMGQLNFSLIPGGLPLLGGNFPAGTTVDSFYISETVVSAAAWEAFLDDQPRWKKENTVTLIKEGLVMDNYLVKYEHPDAPAHGVSGISWHAAAAFCEWLSASLPPQLRSWELRLPSEAEWEYAAKAAALDSDYGRFWEWCEEPYAPLSFLAVPTGASGFSVERSLRGGSWVNPAGSVVPETRASLPPAFCSPFVSFRPVIVPKRTEL